MNRLAGNPAVRGVALLAAIAFAVAPVDLLASCQCAVFHCDSAQGSQLACCCGAEAQQGSCCGQACETANPPRGCCRQAEATVDPVGCACQKVIPTAPTGVPASSEQIRQSDSAGLVVATMPLPAEVTFSSDSRTAWDQELSAPVPVRVLFCVWRI